MRSVESEGESIDAAIEAALKTLGVARDRVEVEILTNASRGRSWSIGTVSRAIHTDGLRSWSWPREYISEKYTYCR